VKTVTHKVVGVAIIWNGSKILIDRRLPTGSLGGLWEFPGGKVEPGESIAACIAREVQEELALVVEVGDRLTGSDGVLPLVIEHDYQDFTVELVAHHCRYLGGEPQPLSCDEIRWVTVAELGQYPLPPANVAIVEALRALNLNLSY
jgi:A/G-specific adenine glycosylase